jgi:hypothetical protein
MHQGFVRAESGRRGAVRSTWEKAGFGALVLLVAVGGLGLMGTQVAAATTTASPAGAYTATIYAPKVPASEDPLTLTAKGHFAFTKGPKGTWTETGTAISMKGTFKGATFTFTIKQSGTNLGSKAHPGLITLSGATFAKWYAVPS